MDSIVTSIIEAIKKYGMINLLFTIFTAISLMVTSCYITENIFNYTLVIWEWSDYSIKSVISLFKSGIPYWWGFSILIQLFVIYYIVPQLIISFGKIKYNKKFTNKEVIKRAGYHVHDSDKYSYSKKELNILEKNFPKILMSIIHFLFTSLLITSKADKILIPLITIASIFTIYMLFTGIPNMKRFNNMKLNKNDNP